MDSIQKTLIKMGRKDLAQQYYLKVIALSEGGFNTWFLNNKDSDSMRDDYKEYVKEHKFTTGERSSPYKQWAKERYESLERNAKKAGVLGKNWEMFEKLIRQAKDLEKESHKDTNIDSEGWVNMSNTMIAMIETIKSIRDTFKLQLK